MEVFKLFLERAGFRHLIRLPRGRHPLRGPFGQMLDAQMSKSEMRKSATRGKNERDPMSFIEGISGKKTLFPL